MVHHPLLILLLFGFLSFVPWILGEEAEDDNGKRQFTKFRKLSSSLCLERTKKGWGGVFCPFITLPFFSQHSFQPKD